MEIFLMRLLFAVLLFFSLQMEAYDASFSEAMKGVYQVYHRKAGDWCDQLSEQVNAIVTKHGGNVSYEVLRQEGVDADYLDAMAVEYCSQHSDAYIATVWPTLDESYEKIVYDILSKECTVAYQKTFSLRHNAPLALLRSIPEKVPHISFDSHRYFSPKRSSYPMRCFVIRAPNHAATVRAKRVLRDLVKLDPYCMHISDTHEQVMDLAYMLLNNNSLHFLNYHESQQFEHFNPLFEMYKRFLARQNIPQNDACVDGSCVLSAYGIRDCAVDFDFLCSKFGEFGSIHPLDHHNSAWERLGFAIDDVIYNPKNFFYYKGYKFASLMKIREFKHRQNRPNDQRDVVLIDRVQ
jgi:hypothetical protein